MNTPMPPRPEGTAPPDDFEYEVGTTSCQELGHLFREDEDRPGRHVCETCGETYED